MLKTITLKAISAEIGQHEPGLLSRKVAFFAVLGAAEKLGDDAWKNGRVTEVQYPSNAQCRKLADKLFPKGTRSNVRDERMAPRNP